MIKSSILCCCLALLLCCAKKNEVILEIIEIKSEIKADTIWEQAASNLVLIKTKDYGHLDEFRNQFVFVKKYPVNQSFAYEIKSKDFDVRVSNNYLYLVNENDHSFGWFYVKNGKILPKLPKIDSILKIVEANNKNLFVREDEGIFAIYKDGIFMDKIHYGDYFLANIDFDELKFGVYQVKNKTLAKVSNDGKSLITHGDGIYYVPFPGYGVNKFYSLKKISDVLDSLELVKTRPQKIFIDQL